MRWTGLVLVAALLGDSAAAQNTPRLEMITTVSALQRSCEAMDGVRARVAETAVAVMAFGCVSYILAFEDGLLVGLAAADANTGAWPYCRPDGASLEMLSARFVLWARAHPERANDRAGNGLLAAMLEAYPCR